MKSSLYILFTFFFALQLLSPFPALAQEGSAISTAESFATEGLSKECVEGGKCTPCEMILSGVRIARFLLGISGAVSLFLLVLAGVFLIASTGNKSTIDKAKSIVKAVVVGLVFVLFSWQIINLILLSLVDSSSASGNSVARLKGGGKIWTKIECTKIQ